MRNHFVYHPYSLIAMFAIAALLGGCSGYHLVIDDATVTEQDAQHLSYSVTVKNEEPSKAFCKGKRFYGNACWQAYLTDASRLDEATVKKGAGGACSLGHAIPNDPNNAYGFRVLDVGESYTTRFTDVTPQGGIDTSVTPYLIFELTSSTDRHYNATFKMGTSGCKRYGMIQVIDLR